VREHSVAFRIPPLTFSVECRVLLLLWFAVNVDGLTNAELQRYLDAGRALYSAEVLEVTGQPRQSRPQSAPMHHESKQASQEILVRKVHFHSAGLVLKSLLRLFRQGRSCYLCGCVYSAHDTVESELKVWGHAVVFLLQEFTVMLYVGCRMPRKR
jgi:hypothetical protein